MTDVKSFVLYTNFFNLFGLLNMEQRGQLITAVFEYNQSGCIREDLPEVIRMAFAAMKDTLDRDRESYLAKCERNRENGKKGGRPKRDSFLPKTECFERDAKKAYNDNDNENENYNENYNDSDNGIGNGNKGEKEGPKEKGFGSYPLDFPISSELPFDAPQACPSPSAPPPSELSEQEKSDLIAKGVPIEYVTERLDRVRAYAERKGRPIVDVLWEWWQGDAKNRRPVSPSKPTPPPSSPPSRTESKSYDLDDFWQAALERSYQHLSEE